MCKSFPFKITVPRSPILFLFFLNKISVEMDYTKSMNEKIASFSIFMCLCPNPLSCLLVIWLKLVIYIRFMDIRAMQFYHVQKVGEGGCCEQCWSKTNMRTISCLRASIEIIWSLENILSFVLSVEFLMKGGEKPSPICVSALGRRAGKTTT